MNKKRKFNEINTKKHHTFHWVNSSVNRIASLRPCVLNDLTQSDYELFQHQLFFNRTDSLPRCTSMKTRLWNANLLIRLCACMEPEELFRTCCIRYFNSKVPLHILPMFDLSTNNTNLRIPQILVKKNNAVSIQNGYVLRNFHASEEVANALRASKCMFVSGKIKENDRMLYEFSIHDCAINDARVYLLKAMLKAKVNDDDIAKFAASQLKGKRIQQWNELLKDVFDENAYVIPELNRLNATNSVLNVIRFLWQKKTQSTNEEILKFKNEHEGAYTIWDLSGSSEMKSWESTLKIEQYENMSILAKFNGLYTIPNLHAMLCFLKSKNENNVNDSVTFRCTYNGTVKLVTYTSSGDCSLFAETIQVSPDEVGTTFYPNIEDMPPSSDFRKDVFYLIKELKNIPSLELNENQSKDFLSQLHLEFPQHNYVIVDQNAPSYACCLVYMCKELENSYGNFYNMFNKVQSAFSLVNLLMLTCKLIRYKRVNFPGFKITNVLGHMNTMNVTIVLSKNGRYIGAATTLVQTDQNHQENSIDFLRELTNADERTESMGERSISMDSLLETAFGEVNAPFAPLLNLLNL